MPTCEISLAASHCLVGRSTIPDFVDQVGRWEREGCANWASVTVYLDGFSTETVEQFHLCSDHGRILKARVDQWVSEGALRETIYRQ